MSRGQLGGTLGALGACLHPDFEAGAVPEAGASVGFLGFSACLGGLFGLGLYSADPLLSGKFNCDSLGTS